MKATFAITVSMLAVATAAAAQTGPLATRAFLSINGGVQAAANDFDDSTTFSANAEDGRFGTDYIVEGGPSLNIGGGVRVWRQLAAGVAITRFSRATAAAFRASVPHPFFFNRPREMSGDVSGLTREELAVHLRAIAAFPAGRRVEVLVFGGPSFFTVKQGVVTAFQFDEDYPYDTATFSRAVVTNADASKVGFNAGADVGFFFTRRFGVGGVIQFSGANIELPSATGGVQDVDVGGVQAGGGLRLRF